MISKTAMTVSVYALISLGSVGTAIAQDALKQRSDAMKAVGSMAKTVGEMLQGKTDFDAEAANAAFANAQANMVDFGTYFPEGSESGESEAASTIWTDPDGFAAAVLKFQGDLDAAIASNPQSEDELKTAFGTVASNCKACHQEYRVQK